MANSANPHPDAALIALCEQAILADKRSVELTEPFYDVVPDDPAYAGLEAAREAAHDILASEYHPAIEAASDLQASTWRDCRPRRAWCATIVLKTPGRKIWPAMSWRGGPDRWASPTDRPQRPRR